MLGDFIQTLPVVVMKPEELIEFSRQTYSKQNNVYSFSNDDFVDSGLGLDELDLLDKIPVFSGKLLILGVGGGREAISLGKLGFHITGVDFVDELVQNAKNTTSHHEIQFEGLVQDISQLEVPHNTFDVVWLSTGMYSCIPSRARRIEMVRRIARALKPGGYFMCQFHRSKIGQNGRGEWLRRFLSVCPFFNRDYETGDMLWAKAEFLHKFSNEDTVRKEFEECGLVVQYMNFEQSAVRGSVVCQKQ